MQKNKYNSSDHYNRDEDNDLMNRTKINTGFHYNRNRLLFSIKFTHGISKSC